VRRGLLVVACVLVAASTVLAARSWRGGAPARPSTTERQPELTAELQQYRDDEVSRRLEVSVENRGAAPVVVERLKLELPDFAATASVAQDAPIGPELRVDLPTPYGEPRCRGDATPSASRSAVVLRVRTADGSARQLRLALQHPNGLLGRILRRECLARRLQQEVALTFGPRWRTETVGGDVRVHGTLEARLRDLRHARDVTQVAGTVIYDLTAAVTSPAPPRPLARLSAARPAASIPVMVSVSRCDGHARAETKKPYAFLVWLAQPGGEEQPLTPTVSDAAKRAFQAVCPL
jgi:hypothetical protein